MGDSQQATTNQTQPVSRIMATRRPLEATRQGPTHHVEIYDPYSGAFDLYLTVNYYEDTREPGEIWARLGKQGSISQGLLDGWAAMVSTGLQFGVPPERIYAKFMGSAFSPAGQTSNKDIPECTSIYDYIVRWMLQHQPSADKGEI